MTCKKAYTTSLTQTLAEAEAAPKATVRIAEDEHTEAFALAQRNAWKASSLEDLTDEALVELMEEGEMLETLTPLEYELLVRLGARLELDART